MPRAKIPKVPKDQFETVIRSLLNAPPLPMSEIAAKGKPKKRSSKKR